MGFILNSSRHEINESRDDKISGIFFETTFPIGKVHIFWLEYLDLSSLEIEYLRFNKYIRHLKSKTSSIPDGCSTERSRKSNPRNQSSNLMMLVKLGSKKIDRFPAVNSDTEMFANMERMFPSCITIANDDAIECVKSKETIRSSANNHQRKMLCLCKSNDIIEIIDISTFRDIIEIPGSSRSLESREKRDVEVCIEFVVWHETMIGKRGGNARKVKKKCRFEGGTRYNISESPKITRHIPCGRRESSRTFHQLHHPHFLRECGADRR